MLKLGLYILRVVGAYKIYIEFVPWKFVQNYHSFYFTLYIDLCILSTYKLYGVTFIHYDSFRFYTIIGDAPPLSNPIQERKKHACFM